MSILFKIKEAIKRKKELIERNKMTLTKKFIGTKMHCSCEAHKKVPLK